MDDTNTDKDISVTNDSGIINFNAKTPEDTGIVKDIIGSVSEKKSQERNVANDIELINESGFERYILNLCFGVSKPVKKIVSSSVIDIISVVDIKKLFDSVFFPENLISFKIIQGKDKENYVDEDLISDYARAITSEQKIKIIKNLIQQYPVVAIFFNTLFLFNKDGFDLTYEENGQTKKLDLTLLKQTFLPESLKVLEDKINNYNYTLSLNCEDFLTKECSDAIILDALDIKENLEHNTQEEKRIQEVLKMVYVFIIRTLRHKKYKELNEMLSYILPINLNNFLEILLESKDEKINNLIKKTCTDSSEFIQNNDILVRIHNLIRSVAYLKYIKSSKLSIANNTNISDPLLSIQRKIINKLNSLNLVVKQAFYSYFELADMELLIDVHNTINKLIINDHKLENITSKKIDIYTYEIQKLALTPEEYEKLLSLTKDFNWRMILILSIPIHDQRSKLNIVKYLLLTIFKDTEYFSFFEDRFNPSSNYDNSENNLIVAFNAYLEKLDSNSKFKTIEDFLEIKNYAKENLAIQNFLYFIKIASKYVKNYKDKNLKKSIINEINIFTEICEFFYNILANDLNKNNILRYILKPEDYSNISKFYYDTLGKVNDKNNLQIWSIFLKFVEIQEEIFNNLKEIYNKFKENDQTCFIIDDQINEKISSTYNNKYNLVNLLEVFLIFSIEYNTYLNDLKKLYALAKEKCNLDKLRIEIKELFDTNIKLFDSLIQNNLNGIELLTWFISENLIVLNENQENQIFKKLIEDENWKELLTLLKERIISWTTTAEDLFFDTWSKAIEENKDLPYIYEKNLHPKYQTLKTIKDQAKIELAKKDLEVNQTKLDEIEKIQKNIIKKIEDALKVKTNKLENYKNKISSLLSATKFEDLSNYLIANKIQLLLNIFLDHEIQVSWINKENYQKIIDILDDLNPKGLQKYITDKDLEEKIRKIEEEKRKQLEKEEKRKEEALKQQQKEQEQSKKENIKPYFLLYKVITEPNLNLGLQNEIKNQLILAIETGNENNIDENIKEIPNHIFEKIKNHIEEKLQKVKDNPKLNEKQQQELTYYINQTNDLYQRRENLRTTTKLEKNLPLTPPKSPTKLINHDNLFIDITTNNFIVREVYLNLTPHEKNKCEEIIEDNKISDSGSAKKYVEDSKFNFNLKEDQSVEAKLVKLKIKDGEAIWGYEFKINNGQIISIYTDFIGTKQGHETTQYNDLVKNMQNKFEKIYQKFIEFYNEYLKSLNQLERLKQLTGSLEQTVAGVNQQLYIN